MAKQHFFFKLIPPRLSFIHDMTEQERALMGEHAAYVRGFFDKGDVLAYGPVMDPGGSFGIALLDMESLDDAERFAQADPTIKAGMNSYKIAPMRIAGAQGGLEAQG